MNSLSDQLNPEITQTHQQVPQLVKSLKQQTQCKYRQKEYSEVENRQQESSEVQTLQQMQTHGKYLQLFDPIKQNKIQNAKISHQKLSQMNEKVKSFNVSQHSTTKIKNQKNVILPKLTTMTSQIMKKTQIPKIKNISSNLCQPKSLQLVKKAQKTYKDQFYLPAFIRNFQLPAKKKLQVIPTMDIFKKRQNAIKKITQLTQSLKNYKILSHLGRGSFSIVSEALNVKKNKKVALKTYVKLDQIQDYKFINILREIQNMSKLKNHKNVVKIESVILEQRKLMIVMQDCGRQSLGGILRKKHILSEQEAKNYLKQIIEGVSYCHENYICHRDLKLQNLLVNEQNQIKIIDFGFSCKADKQLSNICGTAPYMAPQVVLHKLYNGKKADVWSIGVIMYTMLYGQFPFRSNNENQLFRLIQQGKINHNQKVSPQAKEVINMALKKNPSQRPSLCEILTMKWFK